ncbi:hypothetical protein BU16DRAFT_424696, partial [Lophium mytilinum]
LNAATDARKARLAALKSLKRKAPSSTSDPSDSPSSTALTTPQATETPPPQETSTDQYLSGRNYDPTTRAPKLGFDTLPDHLSAPTTSTLEKRAADLHIAVKSEQAKEVADEPLDLFKLQPKRPNWDLKRDLREKYQGLEGETERAIARLVRERVEGVKAVKGVEGGSRGGEKEEVGMEGVALVEAMHQREREGE